MPQVVPQAVWLIGEPLTLRRAQAGLALRQNVAAHSSAIFPQPQEPVRVMAGIGMGLKCAERAAEDRADSE